MYAVYAWNLFVSMVERIAVLVYVKNVGTWAMLKVPNTDSGGQYLFLPTSDCQLLIANTCEEC
jgi:hypothetical protein